MWCRVRATNFKNQELLKEYRKLRTSIPKEIKMSTIEYEKSLAKAIKSDPKLFYAYANKNKNIISKIQSMRNIKGEVIIDKLEIANILNTSFQSVFVKEENDALPNFQKRTEKILEWDWHTSVNMEAVKKILENIDDKKAISVSPYVLKKCASTLAMPLSLVFKLSLDNAQLPKLWKSANVTPIFKKGDTNDPLNYRPVSLTSIPCKILEGLIREKIMSHLKENNLITKHQHGFVEGKACVSNLLETLDFVTNAVHQENQIDLIYMDFAKAFDKVPHKRLIHKIAPYGINGRILKWIEEFLRNRKQRVILGEEVSDWCEIFSGVPQGSVLGPLLFVIFINDLPDNVAAVCKLYVNKKEDATQLQNDINNLIDWSNTWLMKFNKEKCKTMHVGKKNQQYQYTINDNNEEYILQNTDAERDLGVIISSNLKWSNQVNSAVAKAQKALGLIRRTFTHLNTDMVKILYTSLVRPHLEFAVPVWNPTSKGEIEALEKVQRRATKLATEIKHLPYEDRLKRMNLTTLEIRRLRGDLIQEYKIMNQLDEIIWFKQPNQAPSLASSGPSGNLRGHKHRLEREIVQNCQPRHDFFTNRITKHWNELPMEIVEAKTLNGFKAKLDKFFETAVIA